MKVLVIPDVHLKPHMFRQAAAIMNTRAADRAVCLMDIPDDWDREYDIALYEETYDEAIRFAARFPDTAWCYGNHDLSTALRADTVPWHPQRYRENFWNFAGRFRKIIRSNLFRKLTMCCFPMAEC